MDYVPDESAVNTESIEVRLGPGPLPISRKAWAALCRV